MKTSNRFYLPFTEGPCVVTKSVYEQLSKMGFNANYEYSVISQKGRLEVSWSHLTPNFTPKPLIAKWD